MEKKTFMAENENVQKVVALLKAIETGDTVAVGYVNADNYTQHNLTVGDGLAGFGAALAGLADYPEKARVNTVRAFGDGDFVVAQTDYNFYGPKAGFDIFRFEDGKIVEHWDNLMPYDGSKNPSGHTPFDGTIEFADFDKTEENKALVKNFVIDVLKGEHPERLTSYFNGNSYIQHNISIADGLDGLGSALETLAKQNIKMEYFRLHKVLGCGNFVLAVSEGAFAGKPTSYYDLFRVENGKIAEHWDVMETIAPESEWKHQNGKFNGLN
ncbi:nuclear transport factor 2 family protein [Prevotella nigrescens]|mgnify:FL=1|uniref:nuclear transport factor 2 family protein n=1 Tax=Prevotella nigrescens TaxID=28133 RepID=UPI00211B49F5|nr:nuclear transport factor 2 family protein [Prevotella nigrescens]